MMPGDGARRGGVRFAHWRFAGADNESVCSPASTVFERRSHDSSVVGLVRVCDHLDRVASICRQKVAGNGKEEDEEWVK